MTAAARRPGPAGLRTPVLDLAVSGLRHRLSLWLLLAAGVAAATVLPVLSRALQADARAAAVQQAIAQIPPGARSVIAAQSATLPPADAVALDRTWTAAARGLGLADPIRTVVYHPLTVAGQSFSLGGSDRLAGQVRLTGGRLPTSCTPVRCEVVLALPPGTPAPAAGAYGNVERQLGVVLTGTAVLSDPRPAAATLIDGSTPVLLAASATDVSALQTLTLFARTTAWLSDLDPATVLRDGPAVFADRLADATARVDRDFPSLVVQWPSEQVAAAVGHVGAVGTRFGALGAVATTVQLGFAVVAAIALRRRFRVVRSLLLRRGAGAAQVAAVPLTQIAVAAGAGGLAGAALGWSIAAALPGRVSGGRSAAAWAALGSAWPVAAGAALAAAVLAVVVVLWPEGTSRATRAGLDVLLLALVGLSVVVIRTADPAGGASAPVATPVIATATGLLAARCWPLLCRALARVSVGGRSPGVVWTLAVLTGLRRSLLPAAVTGFTAVAVCTCVFAGGYRATLESSADEQAAFQVPLDARVTASAAAVTPGSVFDPDRLRAIDPAITVAPIETTAVTVFPGTDRVAGLPLVGLDPGVLPAVHRFAATTGSDAPPAALAADIRTDPARAAPVAIVPAGTRTLSVTASGLNQDITVTVWAADGSGSEHQVKLQSSAGTVTGAVGNRDAWRVVAVEIDESSYSLVHRQHASGEGTTDLPLPSGTVTLTGLRADGVPVGADFSTWGGDHVDVTGTRDRLAVHYQVGESRLVAVPGFVPANRLPALAVLADPITAAAAGSGQVALLLNGITVPVHVTGVLPRLPTYGARFLLADRVALSGLLDRTQPGTAPVDQFWISWPDSAAAPARSYLDFPPVSTATVTYRADIAARLERDPVAVRSTAVLVAAGGLALILAVIAVIMSLVAARQDEAGENHTWELDGLGPVRLRRVLALRALLLLGVGAVVGVAGGVVLTGAVVRLLAVGAAGVLPQPPLQARWGLGPTALALAAVLVVAAAAVVVAAGTSFREHHPSPPAMDLR